MFFVCILSLQTSPWDGGLLSMLSRPKLYSWVMISTLVVLLERTGFWHWSFSPSKLNQWWYWYHITYVPLVVSGGANSTVQTRETYDPTYCSVKLPGPQPLAPMDAETAERYVAVMTFYHYHYFFHCPQPCHIFCSSHHISFIPIFAPWLFELSVCLLSPIYSCFVFTECAFVY